MARMRCRRGCWFDPLSGFQFSQLTGQDFLVTITRSVVIGQYLFESNSLIHIPESLGGFSLESLKSKISNLMSLNICWALVVVCWIEKIMANLSVVTLQTIASPLMMASFGWSGEITVRAMAVSLGVVGILSLSIAFLFMATKFSKVWVQVRKGGYKKGYRVSPRTSFLFSLCISIFMYIFSYPYPGVSHDLPPYNSEFIFILFIKYAVYGTRKSRLRRETPYFQAPPSPAAAPTNTPGVEPKKPRGHRSSFRSLSVSWESASQWLKSPSTLFTPEFWAKSTRQSSKDASWLLKTWSWSLVRSILRACSPRLDRALFGFGMESSPLEELFFGYSSSGNSRITKLNYMFVDAGILKTTSDRFVFVHT